MVLVAVYREPLIRLSQLNPRLTRGILGYIFVKRVLLLIYAIYGEDAVNNRTVCNWFERFRGGEFDVKNLTRSDQPLTEKADEILQLIAIDRHARCQGIADALGINH